MIFDFFQLPLSFLFELLLNLLLNSISQFNLNRFFPCRENLINVELVLLMNLFLPLLLIQRMLSDLARAQLLGKGHVFFLQILQIPLHKNRKQLGLQVSFANQLGDAFAQLVPPEVSVQTHGPHALAVMAHHHFRVTGEAVSNSLQAGFGVPRVEDSERAENVTDVKIGPASVTNDFVESNVFLPLDRELRDRLPLPGNVEEFDCFEPVGDPHARLLVVDAKVSVQNGDDQVQFISDAALRLPKGGLLLQVKDVDIPALSPNHQLTRVIKFYSIQDLIFEVEVDVFPF